MSFLILSPYLFNKKLGKGKPLIIKGETKLSIVCFKKRLFLAFLKSNNIIPYLSKPQAENLILGKGGSISIFMGMASNSFNLRILSLELYPENQYPSSFGR